MSSETSDLIRRAYERFAQRDIAAILDLFDPGIEFYQTEELPWGGIYRGIPEVRDFFARLLQSIDSRVESREIISAGDRVVIIARLHGIALATARPFDLTAVHVWTFRDGKAVRFEVYIDTPGMLRALSEEA